MKPGCCRARAVLLLSLPKNPDLGRWDAGSWSLYLSACDKICSRCPDGLTPSSQKILTLKICKGNA